MSNFYNIVLEVLKQDERFFTTEGDILRNAVYEAAMQFDNNLIKILYGNSVTKERFFTDVDGIAVFDKISFGWVVNNRQFLPDSYTRFKNKIGLINSKDKYISESNDIELVFPYKDCVLEGGQTKEDQKRDEIFYNETLAPDEIDRLLYPKVFTNAKRYTRDGAKEITEFNDTDNLIIKGNNLLALGSLLKRYKQKVKLIYIDPPYNTGGDANIFSYNNTFNHSTWLTFMKNRLFLAKDFLTDDGFIVITIDHAELFYLGVLSDEIFGRNNRISIVTVQHNPKGRNQAEFFSENSEFMLIYANNKSIAEFNKVVIDEKIKTTFTLSDSNGKYRWESYIRARTVWSRDNRPNNWYPIYVSNDLKIITSSQVEGFHELFPVTNSGEFSWKNIKSSFDKLNKNGYFKAELEDEKILIYHKYYEQQVLKNVWIDKKYQSEFNGTNLLKNLIGETDFSYPKSIYAVQDIIKIMTKPNDLILDFFAGSSTTAHAIIDLNKDPASNRKFIMVEQLQEHIDVSIKRLSKVISLFTDAENRQSSSIVYCELKEFNQKYADMIQTVKNDDEFMVIWEQMKVTGLISCFVNPISIDENASEFIELSFVDKQRLLMELLDKNMLYVNLCDIDDEEFAISEQDKAFTKNFYGRG